MKAIVRTATGRVVTFIRDDVPDGWQPPADCSLVEEADLPDSYEREPVPVVPREWRPDEFRDRFTSSELVAIERLSATDDTLALIKIQFFTSPVIRSDSEQLITALQYLMNRGVLSSQRQQQILGG